MMITARTTRACTCSHRASWHRANGSQPCALCQCQRFVDKSVRAFNPGRVSGADVSWMATIVPDVEELALALEFGESA